jgi:hypothetical protein
MVATAEEQETERVKEGHVCAGVGSSRASHLRTSEVEWSLLLSIGFKLCSQVGEIRSETDVTSGPNNNLFILRSKDGRRNA